MGRHPFCNQRRKMTKERPCKAFAGGRLPMLLQEFTWKKEVIQASEPVLVDFCASLGCPSCRAMNSTIAGLARDFMVCKVNVDTNQELAAHYGISSIHALLIFKGGQIAAWHMGVTSEATLRAEMQKLSQA